MAMCFQQKGLEADPVKVAAVEEMPKAKTW